MKSHVKKIHWKPAPRKKTGLEEALEDIKAGRVIKVEDFHEILKQMGADV